MQGDAEVTGDFAGQPEFLVGHAGGSEERGFAARDGGQFFGHLLDDARPGGFLQLAVFAELRLHETVFAVEVGVVEAAVVAHPVRIDRIVLPRGLADDFVFAAADDRVATGAAGGAEAFRFAQEPDAHFEAEIFARQGADRADVDRIERVIAVEALTFVDGQRGVAAAIDEAEDVVMRHLLHEADAARAKDATFVVEDDVLADVLALGLFDFFLEEVRSAMAEFHGEFLEAAFAGLVADGAVERVVDEEEFHDALAAILDQRGIGAGGHAFGHLEGAGNLRLRRPGDFGPSVSAKNRLPVGVHFRTADFEQAHPAVAGRAQSRMVAVVRDEAAALQAGFDQFGALGELAPGTVNLDVDHGGAVAAVRAHGSLVNAVEING